MRSALRRIGGNLKNHRYIDVYAVALASIVLAILSLVADIVPNNVRWAALLAGVSIIVLRISISEPPTSIDTLIGDRFAFDREPISDRLRTANEVWVFAPSAVNILSVQNCELLRTGPLSRSSGAVRVVVLNHNAQAAISLAIQQLDHSLDYPIQDFPESLDTTMRLLRSIGAWQTQGSFEYRLLSYSPGFSLVAINPGSRDGAIIVEFHGFHNESTSSRMHIEIGRRDSPRWYDYWIDQFSYIWASAINDDNSSASPRA